MKNIVIKKHPIVIIKNLIIIQFLGSFLYFIAAILANYGEIYKALNLTQIISYELAKLLFIVLAEIILIVAAFIKWHLETITIYPDVIIYEKNFIAKKRQIIYLNEKIEVKLSHTPLDKFFNVGNIIIYNSQDNQTLILDNIYNPKQIKKIIINNIKRKYINELYQGESLASILQRKESENIEFKQSMRWDFKEGKVNKNLEKAIIKTIAGFLNSQGGFLIIGVDDEQRVTGLDADYQTLPKKNSDSFQNHFLNIFKHYIGIQYHKYVKIFFQKIEDKEIAIIKVFPSDKPVYVKFDNEELFFVRINNTTVPLKVSEITSYIKSHWS
ncbi:MAG: hypothetical protein KatS3mg097_449 [Candidatus Parcubacteria bacterium]|nr:MAG: hypothetical protein KatS3mg097_449 [Candidatus Parcubacteria bacterium]